MATSLELKGDKIQLAANQAQTNLPSQHRPLTRERTKPHQTSPLHCFAVFCGNLSVFDFQVVGGRAGAVKQGTLNLLIPSETFMRPGIT